MVDTAFIKWCSLTGLEIKDHQVEGINWCYNSEQTIGGIICDEMGLGKTILMLGCIILNKKERTLIVLPPALLQQWKKCIDRFLFGHQAFIFHGKNSKISKKELEKKPIVLTTYGMIATRHREYESLLWKIHWDRLIFDEAHHLRNHKTNTCKGAFKLTANIKWMITGTPIQNKKSDIRILFGLLGKLIKGDKHLKKCISQFLLRRTKKSVGIKLLKVQNENIIVKWESNSEKNLAKMIHKPLRFSTINNINDIDQIMRDLEYKSPLPLYIRARQVCILPKMLKNIKTNLPVSSKINAVVNKIKSESKYIRKIIFCHYRAEIDILESLLTDYSITILDGRSNKKQRANAVQRPTADILNFTELITDKINSFLTPDILIAQINSAAEGLNLQQFSQVYFTSPHWGIIFKIVS